MNNETKPESPVETGAVTPNGVGAGANGKPAEGAASGAPLSSDAAAQAVLDKLMAENAELKDKVLRAHAEMDNIRKRTEREKSEAHKYALTRFASDIVGVGDNLMRAIAAVTPEAVEQNATLKSLYEGVSMTEREFVACLERHGVKRVDPVGQPFNPHQHQAVMESPKPDVPSGTVIQVFQVGYMIEDRVLRPAMVVVATGGAKAGATQPQPANDTGASTP